MIDLSSKQLETTNHKEMISMANKTLSIQDVADLIEKTPRTIRKALRAHFDSDAQPGRGGRWVIAEKDIEKVRAIVESYTARTEKVADFGD